MRITCVLGPYLPVPPVMGGAVERVWQTLASQFARMGHDVTLISRRFGNMPKSEIVDGVHYVRLPSRDAPRSRILYRLFDVSYALKVSAMLPTADITITNSVSLPLLIPQTRAGKIYVSVARFPKGQMFLYRRAHRLQAVSQAVAEAIRQQSPSLYKHVKVLPNTLSPAFSALINPPYRERANDIVYIGRIAREKGLDLLIRAFLSIPGHQDWTLSFVGPTEISAGGDGPVYVEKLRSLCRSAMDRVRFEPPIFDEKKLASRLQRSGIFVYPSVAEKGESFGMAPLEAMAAGCAVIVSALDCFRDFAVDGQNCLIFDHRDASGISLSKALQRLMETPRLRSELALAAYETARGFESERIAKLFEQDFSDLTSECATPNT